MFDLSPKKMTLPTAGEALKGREVAMLPQASHAVLGHSLLPLYPEGTEIADFGMGCFWGCERLFWLQDGVYTTAVGYSAGYTPNPTYDEVCSGRTGHNEVVRVVYWPNKLSYEQLLTLFWENHNPTQGMSQANDKGTQYRSGIYYNSDTQKVLAQSSMRVYQSCLDKIGQLITTEIEPSKDFYFAEEYHQQYLAKNPNGYCNLQSLNKTGLPSLGT